MTATVIGINRQPRCGVCGGRSVKSNRFAMRTDASGNDVMLHLGCVATWCGWRSGTCDVCGEGDHENDPIGPFLDGKGGEGYLHQRCWRQWKSEREVSMNQRCAMRREEDDNVFDCFTTSHELRAGA